MDTLKKSNQIKLSDTYLESLLSEEEKELLEDKVDVDVNAVKIEEDDNYDSLLNEGLDLLSEREETVIKLEPSSNEKENLNQELEKQMQSMLF